MSRKLTSDFEAAVVSAIMADPAAAGPARAIVSPVDFDDDRLGAVYRHELALIDEGAGCDALVLADRIERSGGLAGVPDVKLFIGGLIDAVPTAANVEYHARLVRERARERAVQTALTSGLTKLDQGASLDAVATSVIDALAPVAVAEGRRGFVDVGEVVYSVLESIEAVGKGGAFPGVPLGYPELDDTIGGLLPGDLMVVVAVSGHGKTAFALNVARHAAHECGIEVGVVSAEMTRSQLTQRLLAAMAQVDTVRLRQGRLEPEEWSRLGRVGGEIKRLTRIHVDDTPLPSISEVVARCRSLKARHPKIGLLVVDYIQLLRGDGDDDSRAFALDRIANGLKGLAKELGVPVLATAQPDAKAIEGRQDKRPRLSDIAWSQAIRNAADFVACAYRPKLYDASLATDTFDVVFEKARDLPTFSALLTFVGRFMLIDSPKRRVRAAAVTREVA